MNESQQTSPSINPLKWGGILGLVGFLCGYLGPIILNPNANQGPLVGIFVTGPISFVFGIVLGIICDTSNKARVNQDSILSIAGVIIACLSLYLILPEPSFVGRIIDGRIQGCSSTIVRTKNAISRWEKIIDEGKMTGKPRTTWKKDMERMLDEDKGVILELFVNREMTINKEQKPWNKGKIKATSWHEENNVQKYYAQLKGEDCLEYSINSRQLFFVKFEEYSVSPPDNLPSFLGLLVLKEIPEEYLNFLE